MNKATDIAYVLEVSNSLIEIGGTVPMAVAWIAAIAFSAIVAGLMWCLVFGGSR